ncbi:hypothetical protein [Colwellia maritima]|uniref:hypothetical protein n=1 Tax=Colwellia maritima TaxID=2912588 RepID=UPI00237BC839|nr:hypothetical protein [Colwellia maritima]
MMSGDATDPASRIWPFKKMHTVQPYDKGNNTLVYMHLWGVDDAAFWGNYDYSKAIEKGMNKNNLPYSGEFGFIETHSYWPITHMVAPKENALHCADCHAKTGRLSSLNGVYIPGNTSHKWLDVLGLFLVFATLLGVLVHGIIRKLSASPSVPKGD